MESSRIKGPAGINIVRLDPENVDVHTLWQLERRLVENLKSAAIGLLIDCHATNHVGCGLLNTLLRCHQRATQMNRRVALCALKPLPTEMLAIARLDSLWEIFQTPAEAIAALQVARADGCDADRSGHHASSGASRPCNDQARLPRGFREEEAGMSAFRVWIRPLGKACRVRVDGLENGSWLLTRIVNLAGAGSCAPIRENGPLDFYRFIMASSPSMLHKLLAGIPEVKLMLEPA